MANVTLRLVKGSPLTNSEVDNNFSNLDIFKTEIGGDLGGNVFFPTVIGIQGRSVSNAAPANAQVLSWSDSSNAWIPANAIATYGELTTKPAVNVTLTGDVTGGANVLLVNTNTNSLSVNVSYGYNNLDSRFLKLDNPTTQYVTSYVNFQGNVTFGGNVTTIGANNLIITDNFIYLNDGNNNTNVDFGVVGNYNDGTYAHAGIFRDASDNGTWKIFDGYLPEPDEQVNIDTDNASFRLANLAINYVKANGIIGIVDTSLVTNLNADLLDGQQGTYYVDYTNATNRPAANVSIEGVVTGNTNVSLGVNTNLITVQTTSNSAATVSYSDVIAGNAVIGTGIYGTSVYSNGSPVWTSANDGANSGLDADLLDGQQSSYYLDYANQTNRPAANVSLTGNILGSANASLSAGTNIINISAEVAPNSVTLGTHTVGRFIANVESGTAIVVTGGGSEDSVATVSHADTSTLSGLQGGAGISSITVDGLGHVTAVTSATYLETPGLNLIFTGDVTGSANTYIVNTDTNLVSIGLTVAANSIALGTDTTGNYTDHVISGTGITVSGTNDEGNVITVGLANTTVTPSTYGNAKIVPIITVDQQGRITSASNVTIQTSYKEISDKPAANIVITGDVSGTANAVLTSDSTLFTINTTIQPNSVALGTDTTGNYTDRVAPGTGISVSGTTDEGNVITVGLTTTGVSASTYGNATIVPVITVDAQGRLTNASNVAIASSVANISLSGDVSGSANAILGPNSTTISISTTIQPNSVALGTDTTGNYTDRVVGGTGISISGTTDEGNVITTSLTNTAVTPSTYGNARIIPSFTVDQQGRLTAASNIALSSDVANIVLTGDVSGSANAILGPNSTTISISTTIQPNSVALGTDTTGNYVDRVVGGTGISVSGTADEGNVITASLTNTAVTPSTYGNSRIIPSFTVDQQGRITAASNTTISSDVANIILTGDVSGSANAILGPNSTTISISTTIQPNSVALGTDTTGNYVDRVVGGTGISVSGTADEGNVLTASLTTTGVSASTYGNATLVPVITVDAQGRITSASNVALSAIGTSTNQQILYNSNGNVVGSSGLTYDGVSIKVNGNLESVYQNGSEGGEIFLKNAATSTSIINGVTIDVYQDKLRFFENGGTNRGFYLDITTGNTSAGTNLVGGGGGGSGTTNYNDLTNKPAANIILTGDVSGSANAILTANSTVLSITTTIQPNSVALGTDTTGNYTDRIVGGTGISVSGTADEGNVITASLTNTGVSASTYGNATIVPVITIDAQGRITSASNVTISASGGSNVFTYVGVNGNTITQTNSSHTQINSTQFNFFAGRCAGNAITSGGNNIFLGEQAGNRNTSGNNNIAMGFFAGACNTTGCFNIFAGQSAGFSNTTGASNFFAGRCAGYTNTSGCFNFFAGQDVGRLNTTGSYNIFIGLNAGCSNTFGCYNFFAGRNSGCTNTTGCNNFFSGRYSGLSNTTGSSNFFAGRCAGYTNTTGCNNFFAGEDAGRLNATGSFNIFIGQQAGCSNTFGCYNFFAGRCAGRSNTSGNHNTFLGQFAGCTNSTGCYNFFAGRCAGVSNTTGNSNFFAGRCAGFTNSTGCNNFFAGEDAGRLNTTGSFNVFIGQQAGCSNTFGCNNLFIGRYAGCNNTTGNYNFFAGFCAGRFTSTGSCNIFLGSLSGFANSTGSNNFFAGRCAGFCSTTGSDNVFIGFQAGCCNTVGSCNVIIGPNAGRTNSTGCHNFFAGACAGFSNEIGNYNFFAGLCAGYSNTQGLHNVFIGRNAGRNSTQACHNIFIGECAGCDNSIGKYNVFLGRNAGFLNAGGYHNFYAGLCAGYGNNAACHNVFFGQFAGFCNRANNNFFAGFCAGVCNTTGTNNIFMGFTAGRCNTTGSNNFFAGLCAGSSNTTGGCNVFFGICAGISNTTGSDNLFIGSSSGKTNIFGCNNFFVGNLSGFNNTTACDNLFIGCFAGYNNTTGASNFFAGRCAGYTNTTGCNNFFTGEDAGVLNTTGSFNVFIGQKAGCANTFGCYNFFVGRCVGRSNTTGCHNTFFGKYAGCSNSTGCHNFFAGQDVGLSNSSGCYNYFAGRCAGRSNTTGNSNFFAGRCAGYTNTTGCNNFFSGEDAGRLNTTGSFNIYIGFQSGCSGTFGCYNIFAGRCAGANNTTGRNNFFAGNLAGICNTTGIRNIYLGCNTGFGVSTGNDNIVLGNVVALASTTSNIILLGTGDVERLRVESGNLSVSNGAGNVSLTSGNVFARRFVSSANGAFYVEPAGSNSIIVTGNVYTNQRIGFMNVNSTVSVVYQVYNANARSLDTIFG